MTDKTQENLAAQTIKDLEERRRLAMLAADISELDTLCCEQLAYTHSNAAVDTKAEYLGKLGSGHFDYRALTFSEQEIRFVSDAALVLGRMTGEVIIAGTPRQLNSQITVVWIKQNSCWQLLSFQSTPLPAV